MELKPGVAHMVHADRLKPFVTGDKVELFHFGASPGDEEEEAVPGEWNVESILAHKSVGGKPQFFTRWEGAPPGDETWEPVCNFFPPLFV